MSSRLSQRVQQPKSDGAGLKARAEAGTVVGRDAFSTTYATDAGTTIRLESTELLNFETAPGTWAEISTDVVKDGDRWVAPDHPLSPSFADEATADRAVLVEADGHSVSFSLEDSNAARAEPDSSDGKASDTLRFSDVRADVDLEYEVEPGAVKETLVLGEVPAVEASWSWRLDVGELTPVLGEHDVLELQDAEGAVVMHVPTPVAWDSSGVKGERESALINPAVTLTQEADGSWAYGLAVDPAWLASDERAYPVFIDPTFQWGPPHQRSFKSDGAVYMDQSILAIPVRTTRTGFGGRIRGLTHLRRIRSSSATRRCLPCTRGRAPPWRMTRRSIRARAIAMTVAARGCRTCPSLTGEGGRPAKASAGSL
ncbi:hypothetical protein JOD62_002873 [Microbacterium keratanolyticum]|uniref:hypothetical protein n=1 Tax=Microbacterium keratanolyticum TaxID=67574 RepID=UPI0019571633|nr:hypothetical protein [Microbacterium keratanolyticum]MBM7470325.1 hypothetical protein [Microbacterium keratanolyticum]